MAAEQNSLDSEYVRLMRELNSSAELSTPQQEESTQKVIPDIGFYLSQRGLPDRPGKKYVFLQPRQEDTEKFDGDTRLISLGHPVTTQLIVEVEKEGYFLVLMDEVSDYAKSTFSGKELFATVYNPHKVSPPAKDESILLQGRVTKNNSWIQDFFPHVGYSNDFYQSPEELKDRYRENAQKYLAHAVPTEENPHVSPSLAENLLAKGKLIEI